MWVPKELLAHADIHSIEEEKILRKRFPSSKLHHFRTVTVTFQKRKILIVMYGSRGITIHFTMIIFLKQTLPPPLPHSTASVTLCTATRASRSATGAANGHWTGRLLARAGYVPLLQVMCLWYMCFCAEVFFSVLRLYSKWSIVWGLKHFYFFLLLSPLM